MISLISWISRRVIRSRSEKSTWVRRAVVFVAVVKWIDRRTSGSRVVRLRKGEHAEVLIVPNEAMNQ